MNKVNPSENIANGIDYYQPFVGGFLVLVLVASLLTMLFN